MAEIHLARLAGEAGFEKTVVVKRLLPELVASKAFVAMFLDEGKLVARIDHPNVCEVYELGRDGNEYFLVMPYLDGVPATDFIARPRESDRMAQLRVAAGIVAQACAGLHHAHELRDANGESIGLVHRDVSPSNLFVTTAGVVKVLDFGIAKVRGGEATEVGTIKGKTQYMAPEQLAGESLDRRCDVFALGIVLFELATHQRLFKRSSEFLTAKAIIEETIARADAVDPAVPAPLANVIAKALARKREDRYATARELATAIKGAIDAAAPAEIADALATWHGEELSALRTRQLKVIEEASQVQTASKGRGAGGASQVVTRPARPQSVRDDRDGASHDGNASQAAARPAARPASRPASQAAARPASQTAARPASQAAARPAARPASQASSLAARLHGRGEHAGDGPGESLDVGLDDGPGESLDVGLDDGPDESLDVGLDDGPDDGLDPDLPRRSMASRLLPAILVGAGGLAVIGFFAMRPSTLATHAARDAHVGNSDNMASAPIATGQTADDAHVGNSDNMASAPITTGQTADDAHVGDDENVGSGPNGPRIEGTLPVDAGVVELAADAGVAERPNVEHRSAVKPKPGTFSIDSTPFATIYVDGKRFGITPLVKKQLPAGPHRIRADLKDGRSKEMTVDVPAGKSAAPVRLTW
jgi:serine/threonine-protein kinase